MVTEILKEIRESCDPMPSKNRSLKEWKRQGKKAFGYTCSKVPEEIMYAAGILPVRIMGSTEELGGAARTYSVPTTCYFTRSTLDMGLKGEFADFDGFVMAYTCECVLVLYHAIEGKFKWDYLYYLVVPGIADEEGFAYFKKELNRFKSSLEEFTGNRIEEESMRKAIELCNESRALLREVYDLRGRGLISGLEGAEVFRSSMLMPKEEHNKMVARLIKETPQRKDLSRSDGPRVHISGGMLPNLQLFELIESLGGMVVSDDLCVGSRFFWESVDTTIEPLEALARYYVGKIPCPFMFTEGVPERRRDYILEMLRKYKAGGVIFCFQRFCDAHLVDYPILADGIKAEGVSVLSTEVEQDIAPMIFRPQLEAFFEIVGGKR